MDDKHMQIGEVAARTELSLRTIRHYVETGLVIPSARSQGGFRLYTETDVARLMVIRRVKPLGFTLEQMRDLLDATDRLDGEDSFLGVSRAKPEITSSGDGTPRSLSRLLTHLASVSGPSSGNARSSGVVSVCQSPLAPFAI
ncbi:MerR family transcriptional regulator [Streptomyces cellulosae]|uniref:MerR family transcriptional regulator n=1 Tax=Streptomyces cellulosae TaxID=1968 RepID=A0ABW7YGG8_STRCE